MAEPGASAQDAVVTIVVIAHSLRHELERCFASIAEHSGIAVRTILVDNGSADDTVAWTRSHHREVEVVELPKNMGVAARDHGLRRSRSRYTMFLDSDAALTAGALPAMVAEMDAHPDWGLLGPRLVYDDGTLQLSCRRFPPLLLPLLRRPPLDRVFEERATIRRHLMVDFSHDQTRPVLYVLGACQLFRTELARRAGPFDPDVLVAWEDADWCFRIRDAGGEIVYLPQATVIHSYRRLTRARPVSRAALRQLEAFVHFRRMYASRRGELEALSERLDCQARFGAWT